MAEKDPRFTVKSDQQLSEIVTAQQERTLFSYAVSPVELFELKEEDSKHITQLVQQTEREAEQLKQAWQALTTEKQLVPAENDKVVRAFIFLHAKATMIQRLNHALQTNNFRGTGSFLRDCGLAPLEIKQLDQVYQPELAAQSFDQKTLHRVEEAVAFQQLDLNQKVELFLARVASEKITPIMSDSQYRQELSQLASLENALTFSRARLSENPAYQKLVLLMQTSVIEKKRRCQEWRSIVVTSQLSEWQERLAGRIQSQGYPGLPKDAYDKLQTAFLELKSTAEKTGALVNTAFEEMVKLWQKAQISLQELILVLSQQWQNYESDKKKEVAQMIFEEVKVLAETYQRTMQQFESGPAAEIKTDIISEMNREYLYRNGHLSLDRLGMYDHLHRMIDSHNAVFDFIHKTRELKTDPELSQAEWLGRVVFNHLSPDKEQGPKGTVLVDQRPPLLSLKVICEDRRDYLNIAELVPYAEQEKLPETVGVSYTADLVLQIGDQKFEVPVIVINTDYTEQQLRHEPPKAKLERTIQHEVAHKKMILKMDLWYAALAEMRSADFGGRKSEIFPLALEPELIESLDWDSVFLIAQWQNEIVFDLASAQELVRDEVQAYMEENHSLASSLSHSGATRYTRLNLKLTNFFHNSPQNDEPALYERIGGYVFWQKYKRAIESLTVPEEDKQHLKKILKTDYQSFRQFYSRLIEQSTADAEVWLNLFDGQTDRWKYVACLFRFLTLEEIADMTRMIKESGLTTHG